MLLRESSAGVIFYHLLEKCLLPAALALRLRPNQLTVAGCGLAILVPAGFYLHPGSGFLLILLSGVADALDGLIARRRNCRSSYGAFLDSTLDRVADAFYLAGFWMLFRHSPYLLPATAVLLFAQLCTFLISYTKARAESLGVICARGFMDRGLRTLYLCCWALLLTILPAAGPQLLWGGLLIYCVSTLATVIERFAHIRSGLTGR